MVNYHLFYTKIEKVMPCDMSGLRCVQPKHKDIQGMKEFRLQLSLEKKRKDCQSTGALVVSIMLYFFKRKYEAKHGQNTLISKNFQHFCLLSQKTLMFKFKKEHRMSWLSYSLFWIPRSLRRKKQQRFTSSLGYLQQTSKPSQTSSCPCAQHSAWPKLHTD